MDKRELVIYESPLIAEFISIGWIQNIVAYFIARKVSRKMRRYNKRKAREAFFNNFNKKV